MAHGLARCTMVAAWATVDCMASRARKLICPHPECWFTSWNSDAMVKHADQEHGRCDICGRSILQQFLKQHKRTHASQAALLTERTSVAVAAEVDALDGRSGVEGPVNPPPQNRCRPARGGEVSSRTIGNWFCPAEASAQSWSENSANTMSPSAVRPRAIKPRSSMVRSGCRGAKACSSPLRSATKPSGPRASRGLI